MGVFKKAVLDTLHLRLCALMLVSCFLLSSCTEEGSLLGGRTSPPDSSEVSQSGGPTSFGYEPKPKSKNKAKSKKKTKVNKEIEEIAKALDGASCGHPACIVSYAEQKMIAIIL